MNQSSLKITFAGLLLLAVSAATAAVPTGFNEDESKVGSYTLPDPLVCTDGTKVETAKSWTEKRRPEILELFRSQMQGRSPGRPAEMRFELTSSDPHAFNETATRKEITVYFNGEKDGPQMHLLLYVPNAAKKPVPAFINVNFDGNHTISSDPGITILEQWKWDNKTKSEQLVKPEESTRGKAVGRYPLEMILSRGYAVAVISRNELEPDYAEGWKHGIRGYYLKKSGKTEFAADDWGAIGAWAWGLSRGLDYLETDSDIDAKHVAVMGHSRMGKAALWAGAQDERFALVISNNSGEGGAAISRRWFGETVERVNTSFPHWFCGNYKKYNKDVNSLPFDSHMLISLIAPRPVYVASAVDDHWADPRGEFLGAKNAEPVYLLLGTDGFGVTDMPAIDHPAGKVIGYHVRTGGHDVLEFDWQHYISFADKFFASGR